MLLCHSEWCYCTREVLARKKPNPYISDSDRYPWVFNLGEAKVYVNDPIVIYAALRAKLDAFNGRDPNTAWAWFVQATRKISKHDCIILTKL